MTGSLFTNRCRSNCSRIRVRMTETGKGIEYIVWTSGA
jgi:hypothetical protein